MYGCVRYDEGNVWGVKCDEGMRKEHATRPFRSLPSAAGVRKCMLWMKHLHAASVAVKHRRDFHCLMVSRESWEASVMAKEDRSGPL